MNAPAGSSDLRLGWFTLVACLPFAAAPALASAAETWSCAAPLVCQSISGDCLVGDNIRRKNAFALKIGAQTAEIKIGIGDPRQGTQADARLRNARVFVFENAESVSVLSLHDDGDFVWSSHVSMELNSNKLIFTSTQGRCERVAG